MKLRLTRTLLVALVASGAIGTTYAKGVYLPGQVLDAADTNISSINAGAKTDVFAPSVKDDDTTLKVNVSGKEGNDITASVFSRGGELVFLGEGKDTTSMSVTTNNKGVQAGHAGAMLSAAGKNWTDAAGDTQYATLRVKDVTLNTKSPYAITVGGADGNGHLVVDNAVLDNSAGTSLFIGYYSNRGNDHDNVGGSANGSGTYVSPDSEKTEANRFYGDYESVNGKEFGRGVVTVTNGSTYNTGVSALSIGNGELNITEKSNVVTGWYQSIIGIKTGSIASVSIDNNSSWTVGKGVLDADSYLAVGHGDNTTATINVTNHSELTVKDTMYIAAHTYAGEEYSAMKGSLIIASESTAALNKVYVGNDRAGEGLISVEAGSSVVAWEGAQDASIQVYSKGTIENSGSIDLDLVLTGGQLVANEGSEFAGIMAESGTITINGLMTVTGDMVLGSQVMTLAAEEVQSDAVTIIYKGGAIDLAGNNLTLGSGVVVQLAEGVTVEEEELALFTNVGNAQELSELNIEVQDSNGDKLSGVKITASIPEPTTATLSLLALAALAARRRRN